MLAGDGSEPRSLRPNTAFAVPVQYLPSNMAGPKDLARGSAIGVAELEPAPAPRNPMLLDARVVTFAVRLLDELWRSTRLGSRLELLLLGLETT